MKDLVLIAIISVIDLSRLLFYFFPYRKITKKDLFLLGVAVVVQVAGASFGTVPGIVGLAIFFLLTVGTPEPDEFDSKFGVDYKEVDA